MPAVTAIGLPGKSSCLINLSYRRYGFHNVFSSAVCTYRHTAAYYFAHCYHVRLNAEILAGTTERKTEACYNLVKYKHSAVLFGYVTKELQKAVLRWYNTHVCRYRLYNKAGNFVRILFKKLFNRLFIVVFRYKSAVCKSLRYSCTVRNGVCNKSGTGFDEKSV